MDKLVKQIKDLRYILAFLGISGTTSWSNASIIESFGYDNLPMLILTSFIVTWFFMYYLQYVNETEHKEMHNESTQHRLTQIELQKNMKQIVLKSDEQALRAEIKQAYKDYENVDVIDFETTIKYLNGLNKRRIELGINSYSEEMITVLLNKIKL